MSVAAVYNEIDLVACAVLEEQIARGVIASGTVQPRSIKEITFNDIKQFRQVHLFAGGGLWSVAARLAGWPDAARLWTASCPCQPFSAAGKQGGKDDPRHLWPDVFRLVREAGDERPPVIMGEQVSGKAGYDWFDGVRADLESEGYTCGAIDIPACAIDAPHQRNRLYWFAVANTENDGRQRGIRAQQGSSGWPEVQQKDDGHGTLDHGLGARLEGHAGHGDTGGRPQPDRPASPPDGGELCLPPHPNGHRCDGSGLPEGQERQRGLVPAGSDGPVQMPASYWSSAVWIDCHDNKARRAEPGIRLLAHGISLPLDLLRRECLAVAEKEVMKHVTESNQHPAEALRVLWLHHAAQTLSAAQQPGVCSELPAQAFLFDFMRHVVASCAARYVGPNWPESSEDDGWQHLRSLWNGNEPSRSSPERQCAGQHSVQPSDAVQQLSRILACRAETLWQASRHADANAVLTFPKNRVGMWRIAGNAIVPGLAAQAIAALMDVYPDVAGNP